MHMQDDFPLLLSTLYDRAVWIHPDQELVSVESDLSQTRWTYSQLDGRIRRLASAFENLGIEQGDAVATFAWNNIRHHELYWATANTGMICHTINIRLFADQVVYVANHAEDKVVFVDPGSGAVIAPLASRMETVRHDVVVLGAEASPDLPGLDRLRRPDRRRPIGGGVAAARRALADDALLQLGTTGNPKGVAYTQRSTYLHTISNLASFSIEPSDNVLPVVPMFHASAWGYPFMATTRGAKLTYPGPDLSPEGLVKLFVDEEVTFSAGVPTVWLGSSTTSTLIRRSTSLRSGPSYAAAPPCRGR
jgi:acyl-CoA synthetase (AMP-forming)/AMP-acid ligase II